MIDFIKDNIALIVLFSAVVSAVSVFYSIWSNRFKVSATADYQYVFIDGERKYAYPTLNISVKNDLSCGIKFSGLYFLADNKMIVLTDIDMLNGLSIGPYENGSYIVRAENPKLCKSIPLFVKIGDRKIKVKFTQSTRKIMMSKDDFVSFANGKG